MRILNFKFLVFTILIVVPSFFYFSKSALAVSESDCLNKDPKNMTTDEQNECSQVILPRIAAAYAPAQQKNKEELANLKKQIDSLNQRITSILSQLKRTETEISDREEDLAYTNEIFDVKVLNDYKRRRLYDPITPFLTSNAVDAFREVSYQQMAAEDDRKVMEEYGKDLATLKTDKENLEKNKVSLASLQKKVTEDAKFLEGEVGKVDSFLTVLDNKQKEILEAKAGSFITSVGDVELADDFNASIKGFRESAPAGSFAVFSFGGYTHRLGMSQYGARGRANAGKSYDEILKAYYDFSGYEDKGGITIKVNNGNGVNKGSVVWTGSLDEYVKRIYEIPASWPSATLQAQAIAARSYVLAVTNNGAGTICANEHCQVFKTQPKGGNWESAVNSTAGKVMVSGGQPIKAYFSSTTGGYLSSKGWDTTNGSGGGDFINNAWESKGGSPWLYKAWYRKGYTSGGATCAKSNPWLTNSELADVVNAALAIKKSGVDQSRVISASCFGGNPYSVDELRNVSGGISSISDIRVLQGNGITNEVVVNGSIRLTGLEFKRGFNLRAPGYLRIPQGIDFGGLSDFAFFNIEKK